MKKKKDDIAMNKIKVLYDYQIMLAQRYGGISRYFYELITHINKTDEAYAEAFCVRNANAYFEKYFNGTNKKPVRGLGFLNRIFVRSKIKKYDIVHPTYYHPYVLVCKRNKLVVTVYDMIHELFPEMFSGNDTTAENKKQLIYGSDHIIAISESTKRDILKFYPEIPAEKISVIYIGSNMSSVDSSIKLNLPEKYILFVGMRSGYKNFTSFIKSVKPILAEDSGLGVVCLGGDEFKAEEKELIAEFSDRVVQMNVYDKEMAYVYSKAKCFVFPSLYEGFGIPTLEAFGCDCPVVLSNTSSMPEVGGEACVYFDPTNEEDMREKIRQVIYDESLRMAMIEKGRVQLKKFEWDKIAAETIACYKKVLKNGEYNGR